MNKIFVSVERMTLFTKLGPQFERVRFALRHCLSLGGPRVATHHGKAT